MEFLKKLFKKKIKLNPEEIQELKNLEKDKYMEKMRELIKIRGTKRAEEDIHGSG